MAALICVVSPPTLAALVSATLPASRSVQVGEPATLFATVISTSAETLDNCRIALATPLDATLAYQTTDPVTNTPVGTPNTPVALPANASQSFVLAVTAASETPVTNVAFDFLCDGVAPAAVVPGLNTLLFSASDMPVPDIVALAATVGGAGVSEIPEDEQFGFFTVAAVNVGSGAALHVDVAVGNGADAVSSVLVCRTNASAACLGGPSPPPITVDAAAGATPTFAAFFNSRPGVPFDPARNRVFVNFSDDDGQIRGSTSVAFRGGGSSTAIAGHPSLSSPHTKPIVAIGDRVYVANTPADTVDVIDVDSRTVIARIPTGVDPVALAARPDGRALWVANHVSDTISVIDTHRANATYHQVIESVQVIDATTFSTRFDEPLGIAFASNAKAYVALSAYNEIAVVDAATYAVTNRLPIRSQDPRALAVHGNRLYVLPFESNNQSQLSGCRRERIDGDTCTFDAVEHVFTNNNVLSLNYDADIVKNPGLPDRDLYVFDTATDELVQVVDTLGTLLYGIAVDRNGRVFVAQTDARNVANGRAGTRGHGLAEMENRAFLNQITRVDCASGCGEPRFFDLEPLPPTHPAPGNALATPFGIQVSRDGSTLLVTAAGSNRLASVDPDTGAVLDRIDVGAVPRGIALRSTGEGAPATAWVLNAVDNSVSVIDVSTPSDLRGIATIPLADPTHPDVKDGRRAFNDAAASTTGTFSCESCHPDGHTDQLVWVLDTPVCDVPGCTQIPPRLTMPVRGLRDTAPYHWDGIPGDPFGGTNTASINTPVAPNCSADDPESCTRVLVDGSLATTMCHQTACPHNDEGNAGALDGQTRDALSRFLLSVPYPPAQHRPFDNVLTQDAIDGFFEFSFINDSGGRATGAPTCGDCHKMPFLVSTNTPGTGMDAPTWRGAYDRWMVLPQGRLNIVDLLNIVGMDDSFPEQDIWTLAGASADIWQMVLEASTGFSGSFARQVTLNARSAGLAQTTQLLTALELSASEGAVRLQGEGVLLASGDPTPFALEFANGVYHVRGNSDTWSRTALLQAAASGTLIATLTGRAGINVTVDHPQPALWPVGSIHAQTRNVEIAFLSESSSLRVSGRHIEPGAVLFVDGRRVSGQARCESGTLPRCNGETLIVELAATPEPGGLHFLQIQNSDGLFSNDMMFFSEQSPALARDGNLITSGGAFAPGQFDDNWNTVEVGGSSIRAAGGELLINATASVQPWHTQLSHAVAVSAGQQYTLCYRARGLAPRTMAAYVDSNMDAYDNLSGGQHTVTLSSAYQQFRHTFTAPRTDLRARVAFDFAQSGVDARIDDIGLYEGNACGTP